MITQHFQKLIVVILLTFCANHAYAIDLTVNIFKPLVAKGTIYVDLHTSQSSCDDFDDKTSQNTKPYATKAIPATEGKVKVVFKEIPMGIYAVSVFHDLNDDQILNRQLFPNSGVPTESFGTSNNYFSPFSKPLFDHSSFAAYKDKEITINLRHNYSELPKKIKE